MYGTRGQLDKGASSKMPEINVIESLRAMQNSMDRMNESLIALTGKVDKNGSVLDNLKDIKESVDFAHSNISEMKNHLDDLRVKLQDNEVNCDSTMRKLLETRSENKILKDQLLHLDWYIRRENLKIRGIPGDADESNVITVRKVRELLVDKLKLPNGNDIIFQRCHRLRQVSGGVSDVIIRFAWYSDREAVWKKRFELKGSNIYINEDLPFEMEKRRVRLYPIFKAAKDKKMNVSLKRDKLQINGTTYNVDTLDNLPLDLQPATLSCRVLDNAVLFYGRDSWLSNFFPARFTIEGKTYLCSEQFYQYKKAQYANNMSIADQIMKTSDPADHHRLGKKLHLPDDQWNTIISQQVMEEGLTAKFDQNVGLRQKLLDTGNKLLVECNQYDLT